MLFQYVCCILISMNEATALATITPKRGRPTKKEVKRRPENRCTATSRTTGMQCGNSKGWGTDHPGEGKCKIHGGATPRHAIPPATIDNLNDVLAEFAEDPNILMAHREVAVSRMLRDDLMDEYLMSGEDKITLASALMSTNNAVLDNVKKMQDVLLKGGFILTAPQLKSAIDSIKRILNEELAEIRFLIPEDRMHEFNGCLPRIGERLEKEVVVERLNRPAGSR